MRTNTMTFAIDAVVLYSMNEFRMPSANAAMTAPLICPRPPTMGQRQRRHGHWAADDDDEEGVDQVALADGGTGRPDECQCDSGDSGESGADEERRDVGPATRDA